MDEKNIKDRLKDMSFKEKLAYIWEYYRIQIIAIVATIAMFCSIINFVFINPPKKLYAGVALHGQYVDMIVSEELEKELNMQIPDEFKDDFRVELNNFYTADNPQINMALTQKFAAMAMAGELNLLITTQEQYVSFTEQKVLYSLNEMINKYDLPQENLLADGNNIYGVLIPDNSPLSKYDIDLPVLCIISESRLIGANEGLLAYLLGSKQPMNSQ